MTSFISKKVEFNPMNLINILDGLNVCINSNIIIDIAFYLQNTKHCHNHISFIVDNKNRNIITYMFNSYYNSKVFPFSSHSEINSINKCIKLGNVIRNRPKVILIVVKLSKTGILGMSKPCYHCRLFINSNYENLNLIKIYYSNKNNLEELNIMNLLDKESQHLSAGYSYKRQFKI